MTFFPALLNRRSLLGFAHQIFKDQPQRGFQLTFVSLQLLPYMQGTFPFIAVIIIISIIYNYYRHYYVSFKCHARVYSHSRSPVH